jgi:hypothetical protein
MIIRTFIVAGLLATGLGCSNSQPEPRSDAAVLLSVTPYGIGPVRAGMSIAEASKVLGTTLSVAEGSDPGGCQYAKWPEAPDGVLLMIESHSIARVDVRSGATATHEGARIGDSADKILQLYKGRVTVTPHKYTDGQYLTVTPVPPAEAIFLLVFEIEGGRVTRYRSGKLPQVEYVEGCS